VEQWSARQAHNLEVSGSNPLPAIFLGVIEMDTHRDLLKQLREHEDLPITSNHGKGTSQCYQVQARACVGCGPKLITGAQTGSGKNNLIDSHWETLYFSEGPIGVPASQWNDEFARHGFFSYRAAQALRWWFLAAQPGITAIETRLVEYKFEYSYSAEAVRAVCVVDPEKREDLLPDWGKKELKQE
jgi:hypothetical protein